MIQETVLLTVQQFGQFYNVDASGWQICCEENRCWISGMESPEIADKLREWLHDRKGLTTRVIEPDETRYAVIAAS
jgi:hypothetical protein